MHQAKRRGFGIKAGAIALVWLVCTLLLTSPLLAHEQSLANRLDYLGRQVAETANSVGWIWLIIVATYLVAATAAGGCCAVWAMSARRRVAPWFIFGFLLPIIAVPVMLAIHARLHDAHAEPSESSS